MLKKSRRNEVNNISKRRANGEGLLRKRDDGRWEVRIVVGRKENGEPIYKSCTDHKQKEALRKLNELKETYKGMTLTEDSLMTLAEWLDKWMREYKKPPVLRESTYDGYMRDIKNHIKPYLGSKMITQIKHTDVQKFVNKLKKEGRIKEDAVMGQALSSATVRGIHGLLHEAMDSAMLEGLIPSNPCEDTVLPRIDRKEKTIVGIEQMQKLIELLREDGQWHDFFFTDFLTGMRRGEICGLRWEDFDNNEGKLKIQRTVSYIHGKPVVSPPKTEEGNRTVCLPNTLWWILSDRQEHTVSEWIFCDPLKPENPVRPSSAYNRLRKLLKQAELERMRFHDLRHSFASVTANIGVAPQILSGIVGHTKASFTLDTYAHVTTEMQKNASKIVDNFLTDVFGKELKPWQKPNVEKPEKARSDCEKTDGGKVVS